MKRKGLLVRVPITAAWVLGAQLISLHSTMPHDGFLKLAQDMQCKAVKLPKEPQNIMNVHTSYVLSLRARHGRESTICNQMSVCTWEHSRTLKVRSRPKIPVASTLADLHFVQHIQSMVAFNTTTFQKKKKSFKLFQDYCILGRRETSAETQRELLSRTETVR